jgi:hypothetical protein
MLKSAARTPNHAFAPVTSAGRAHDMQDAVLGVVHGRSGTTPVGGEVVDHVVSVPTATTGEGRRNTPAPPLPTVCSCEQQLLRRDLHRVSVLEEE